MADSIGIVILAAGKGTRLKVDIPKPLCPILGRTLVDYVLDELILFTQKESLNLNLNAVVGHEKEAVEDHIKKRFEKSNNVKLCFPWQAEQLGTGHALQTYFEKSSEAKKHKYTIVVCADTPLITASEYSHLFREMKKADTEAICASFIAKDPTGYGRIVKGQNLEGFNIIEEKDADDDTKKINEVNSGLYIFKTSHILKSLFTLDSNNNSNEIYLTDLFKKEYKVKSLCFSDERIFIGVNNLVQLEECSIDLQKRKIIELQLGGVRFINSRSVYIEKTVKIAAGSVIYPGVNLIGNTSIGKNTIIEAGVVAKNSVIGSNNLVKAYTYLEGATVGAQTQIGPMARLREGSEISNKCRIGNFVEIKKSKLDEGAKISHLSYVGDAEIGKDTNIGCGFITCNYDGANKHKTIIGEGSFIGSDCQMIAPVTVGNHSYVGSGSTINQDVPDGAFAIARQRQVTKEGMAKKFIKKKS